MRMIISQRGICRVLAAYKIHTEAHRQKYRE